MKYIIILSLIILTSCRPGHELMDNYPDEASPLYKKAWHEGCESGITAYSNDFYKAMYSFNQDSRLIDNPEYYNTWRDAYQYCRHYINEYLKAGIFDQTISDDLRNERIIRKDPGIVPDVLGW